MITSDGIRNKIYEEITNNALKDLINFQNFLYRHFKDYENRDDMGPVSKELAKSYGTAKTYSFDNLENITSSNLKYCLFMDQTGVYQQV